MQITTFLMPDYATETRTLVPEFQPNTDLPDGWYYTLGTDAPVGPFAEHKEAAEAAFAHAGRLLERPLRINQPNTGHVASLPLPYRTRITTTP